MKNKQLTILIILGITAIFYFLTNDIGYCAANAAHSAQTAATTTANTLAGSSVNSAPAASTAAQTATNVPTLQSAILKFLYAMAGVVVSSLLIFGGLTLYNKIFVKNPRYHTPEDDILKTPKTVDDAIVFFIKKNKLN